LATPLPRRLLARAVEDNDSHNNDHLNALLAKLKTMRGIRPATSMTARASGAPRLRLHPQCRVDPTPEPCSRPPTISRGHTSTTRGIPCPPHPVQGGELSKSFIIYVTDGLPSVNTLGVPSRRMH